MTVAVGVVVVVGTEVIVCVAIEIVLVDDVVIGIVVVESRIFKFAKSMLILTSFCQKPFFFQKKSNFKGYERCIELPV